MVSEYLIYLQLLIGFALLIKGADLLVHGASALAKRLHVSDMIIGLTVVSFGTSAPEFAVNAIASWEGRSGLALGNIIGSNTANILLVLGVAALAAPLAASKKIIQREIPMNVLAAVVLGILVNDQFIEPNLRCIKGVDSVCNFLGRGDGIMLLVLFFLFLLYVYYQALESRHSQKKEQSESTASFMPLWKVLSFMGLGLLGLVIGGDWIVKGSIHIAKIAGLSDAVIGITIIGIGTSLPEVAASATAAYRRNAGLAIGNALGSNLFNILWVLGLNAAVNPLAYDLTLNLHIAMMTFSALLFYFVMLVGKRYELGRRKGFVFLLVYAVYITFLVHSSLT